MPWQPGQFSVVRNNAGSVFGEFVSVHFTDSNVELA